ncbi:MAG: hypothetical protein ACK4FJ_18625 [Ferrovibrio sp.]|uniref:deoxynucleotide monophosphate kinase family protein n=1 Tax=Ferrovibrio sp. TaxID=1917215 RepID=UPI003919E6B9
MKQLELFPDDYAHLPSVIALYSSIPQRGKGETAKILIGRYGYRAVSFAEPLRRMTVGFLMGCGIPEPKAWDYATNRKEEVIPEVGYSVRYLMQTLGTEWGRNVVNQDLWLNLALSRIAGLTGLGERVVIDDMRFPNEYARLAGIGATMWRIERDAPYDGPAHVSNGLLDGADFNRVILNNGTLEDLRGAVRGALNA